MLTANLLRLIKATSRTQYFFLNDLKEIFANEDRYDEAGLTPEQRLRERQSLESKKLRIRSSLDSELAKVSEFRSQYYTEALNYLNYFGDEIFFLTRWGNFQ